MEEVPTLAQVMLGITELQRTIQHYATSYTLEADEDPPPQRRVQEPVQRHQAHRRQVSSHLQSDDLRHSLEERYPVSVATNRGAQGRPLTESQGAYPDNQSHPSGHRQIPPAPLPGHRQERSHTLRSDLRTVLDSRRNAGETDNLPPRREPSLSRSQHAESRPNRPDAQLPLEERVVDPVEAYAAKRRSSARNTPYSQEIVEAPIPPGCKLPRVKEYDGTADPAAYVSSFGRQMEIQQVPDHVACRVLGASLIGAAATWLNTVPARSIKSYDQLCYELETKFASAKARSLTSGSLLKVKQRQNESTKSYLKRFQEVVTQVIDYSDEGAKMAFMDGLSRNGTLHKALTLLDPHITYQEILVIAEQHIRSEDASDPETRPKREDHQGDRRRDDRDKGAPNKGRNREGPSNRSNREKRFNSYTPLNDRPAAVLFEIQRQELVTLPKLPTHPRRNADKSKYCRYHRYHGHNTDECDNLKDEIEALIRKGKLQRFVDNPEASKRPRRDPSPDRRDKGKAPAGVINMIHGDPQGSQAARKRSAREFDRERPNRAVEKKPREEEIISFSDEDLEGVRTPHSDTLLVTARIQGYDVSRILVDTGSSAEILYWDCFQKMKLSEKDLVPTQAPLVGFNGSELRPEGTIELPVTFGTYPRVTSTKMTFCVIKASSAYNVILGRTGLNSLQAVISNYHLKMKFPTPRGVGESKGDQRKARTCYAAYFKRGAREVMPAEALDVRTELQQQRIEPDEDLIKIPLDESEPSKTVQIGALLTSASKEELIRFLKDNADLFAWSSADVPGIDPKIIEHSLGIHPDYKPVRQKKRSFAPDRQRAIAVEVSKLLQAGFIREVKYTDWLANVVMVPKPNGKWRMCIDFSDLNKACPKDNFPLPRIDQLVDSTAGHELLSFMDAFSGYNQIRMREIDEERTSFITDQGIYCYKVMPFGLKNAGATYQRLVNKMFEDQIGQNVEVYVDDMLVKSLLAPNHVTDLKEAFGVLRRYQMRLNPEKCAFGVTAGKFLGFMVQKRGIEANPTKINAIINMVAPAKVKELQTLTGRIVALSRFVSRLGERCLPFFKTLRKAQRFNWDEDCQVAFDQLKEYLASPPLLSSPKTGEELFLYLSVSAGAVSVVLVREDDGLQRPIYYVSRVLLDAETRYQELEKMAYALVIAARKLRPYFQAHTIVVLTNAPLRQVL